MLQERWGASGTDLGSPRERRRQVRQLALLRVALLHSGGVSDICVVRNVSPNGLSARVYRKLSLGVRSRSSSVPANSSQDRWSGKTNMTSGSSSPRPIDVTQVLASRWSAQREKRRA